MSKVEQKIRTFERAKIKYKKTEDKQGDVMKKVIYLLWPDKKYSPRQRRELLLEKVQPEILAVGVNTLTMNIDDEYSQVKSPAPKWYRGPALVATVSVKVIEDEECQVKLDNIYQQLTGAGFKVGRYEVDESVYKDYGDNAHFRKRDWKDGERTPSVVMAITLLTRPKKFTHAEWIRRWHGKMSPGSEVIQPRARYVRNVVLSAGDDSPAFDGIVEEGWPSAEHIRDPYKFYLARNPFQLVWHMIKMLRLITQFHQLHKIRTVTMSEYFLKTDFPATS